MLSDPRELDLPLMRVISGSRPYLLHSDDPSWPLAIVFHVPRHLAPTARKVFGEGMTEARTLATDGNRSNHLVLID